MLNLMDFNLPGTFYCDIIQSFSETTMELIWMIKQVNQVAKNFQKIRSWAVNVMYLAKQKKEQMLVNKMR